MEANMNDVGSMMIRSEQLINVNMIEIIPRKRAMFDATSYYNAPVQSSEVSCQKGAHGLISSTVVDFRVGRLLGVVFIGVVGDHDRLDQVLQLGQTLEKRIVSVVLGSA